ncbi:MULTISPECIES: amidase [unclassified Mesorhizobium]|uniref:amidase n=1 Tax=unclassified Mesorhizobium TaxID=325217 RepID=UPI000FC9E1C9|nr:MULTISPECIES: amidase [unclassified Mesorhizobium]RUW36404.1 amidase [Mesorhizobium sp. M1E.F.Ca.ET.041.01.1.1]RWD91734.1 MAG: amidase [Mesorhizobium sp.]RWD92998.1 MAG: amidase [Mesorhizobium sp.]TIV55657.1 MAG: amidase [Mesorhizobium sp.]TKB17490.1 MAG: amidase [Mesorhizobium sp.]
MVEKSLTKARVAEETIAAAEKLLGLSYTAAERAQMADNLGGQIDAAQDCRAMVLPNDAPTASRFDPRPPGFRMPPGPDALSLSSDLPALPANAEDIAFAPLTHLAGWMAKGALTSRALTEIYLDRISALAPRLECFVTVTRELALAQAEAADALTRAGVHLGPLHGIPYALKDLFDTKGIVTGWGAEPYRDRAPDSDAFVVRVLRAAGAVLLGKTAVGALADGDTWYGGIVRNPWNLGEGARGSSAGSASAVATGLCGFSIGTETLGSIVAPSDRCGATGLRPTFGRVSRAGVMVLCPSLDKVGPICRGVEDCAIVLSVLNGADPEDTSSIAAPFRFDATAGISGLRLGYLPKAFGAEATAVDHAALAAARRLGNEVVEVSLPELPYGSLKNLMLAEAAATFQALTLSDQDDLLRWQGDEAWPNTFRKAWFLSAVDHVQLDRLRYQVMLALDGLFAEVDALIGPLDTGPMPLASNFTGHPCLHMRAGFLELATRPPASVTAVKSEAETGLKSRVPQGISLWGRLFDEGKLLALGLALEAALGVAAELPRL